MPDWFAPVVSVIALAFSVLSPLMLGFFDLRKAAQERKMIQRRESRESLSQVLSTLIDLRGELEGQTEDFNRKKTRTDYGKAYAIMLSIADPTIQELAQKIAPTTGPRSSVISLEPIDAAIKHVGELLSREIE